MKRPDTIFTPDAPRQFKHRDTFGMVVVAAGALFAACGVATQFVAWRLGFPSNLPGEGAPVDPGLAESFGLLGPILLSVGALSLLFFWVPAVRELLPPRRCLGLSLLLSLGGSGLWAYSLPVRYAPYRFAYWAFLFAEDPVLLPYVQEGGAVMLGLAFAAALGTFLFVGGRHWQTSTSYGSAQWGDASWLEAGPPARESGLARRARNVLRRTLPGAAALLPPAQDRGFPIGKKKSRMLYDRSGLHAFICAPTGAGKTVGFSIPALLMHTGSALVIDIKRELYHVTARRRMELNGTVYRLDPFGDQTASYNPMGLIETAKGLDTLAMDDAKMIADMCIVETGKENNPFFIQTAKQLLTGIILAVAYTKKKELVDENTGEVRPNPGRSLWKARRILMLPNDDLRSYLKRMMFFRDPDGELLPEAVRGIGAQFGDMNEKVFSDVVSTARQQTFFLDSPAMKRCISETTIHFSELKRGEATIYLVLPDERLGTYNRWLRLMVTCAQTEIVRIKERPDDPILFLLDEFPRLGRFPEIDKGVSLHRSYGIQYVLITQTMAQLKETYGELAKNFAANAQNRILWAASDEDAAQYVSDMAGELTVAVKSTSKNRSSSKGKKGGGSNKGITESIQERSRKLVTPGEALTLPSTHCFVFTRERSPLVLERPNYLTDPQFVGPDGPLYDPNPEHATASAFQKARQRRVEMGIEQPEAPELPPRRSDSQRRSSEGGTRSSAGATEKNAPEGQPSGEDQPSGDDTSESEPPEGQPSEGGGRASSTVSDEDARQNLRAHGRHRGGGRPRPGLTAIENTHSM